MFRLVISEYNLNKIGIIRVRYQIRLGLQDILVYSEPGTVHVHLDSISRATGTPLNDVLQNWKDKKQGYDRETYALARKRRTADPSEQEIINEDIKKATAAYYDDIFQMIVDNKNNDVGQFIYSLSKGQFTEEQVQKIEN